MKRIILSILSLMICATAMLAEPTIQQKYIEKYAPTAVSEMKRSGVPASITLAQGIIESSSGTSALAVKANNHFGIKCHTDWNGDKYYQDDDELNECFRVYPSAELSFRDHSDFLRFRDRYKSLFELDPLDYKGWAKGLKSAGYATNPQYASMLIKVIEDYGLYIYDKSSDVPQTPLKIEKESIRQIAYADETHEIPFAAPHYIDNGTEYVIALDGDSYASIASSNGLFENELRRYNDAGKTHEPAAGEKIYLKSKKARAAEGLDKYIVESDGESLRDISQRFGVKLSSLMKMNRLKNGHTPKEGDTILLR